jgi:hypothetical protein
MFTRRTGMEKIRVQMKTVKQNGLIAPARHGAEGGIQWLRPAHDL